MLWRCGIFGVIFVVVIEPILFGIQAGFTASDSKSRKLTKMLRWALPSIRLPESDPEHYDVFSYVSKYVCLARQSVETFKRDLVLP